MENNENNTAVVEMPKYKCHKEVWALRIAGISLDGELFFEGSQYAPKLMKKSWLDKHNPEVGGYYVVYKNGYESFSPYEAFIDGYTLLEEK